MANIDVEERAGGVYDPSVYDLQSGLPVAARYAFTDSDHCAVDVGTSGNTDAYCIRIKANFVFLPTIFIKILLMYSDGHMSIHRTHTIHTHVF